MARLILQMSTSVDGFTAGPNGEGDWVARTSSPDGAAWLEQRLRAAEAHLMGRTSYEMMGPFWQTSASPLAAPMNEIPKIVFSRTGVTDGPAELPSSPAWEDALVLAGELAEQIAELKAGSGGELLAHGGSAFGRSLVATGLIDEYRLVVHPVVLGSGQSLFDTAAPVDLRLVESTMFDSGTAAMVYRPV